MRIVLLLAGLLAALGISAQTGAWHGCLKVQGTEIPVVFHLDDDSPSLDSPSQGAKGIPASIARLASDSLVVNIPAINASFQGKHSGGKITGIFSQNGMKLPLKLSPVEQVSNRPQTPVPPFPYGLEYVSFSNGETTLSGTLTLPEGYDKNTPAVIMITGSGLQNRDEEIFDHKPFAVIADALARAGIASLRYDDRGFGESTGDAVNCTTEDLKQDALAGIELLRGRFNNVGALGHSEGGTIALMIGADQYADFIISLAGMAVSGKETLLEQNRQIFTKLGLGKDAVDEYCLMLSIIFDGDNEAAKKIEASSLPPAFKANLHTVIEQTATPYMQHLLSSDPRKCFGNIRCPVLALNGLKDTQVLCDANLEALRRGLPENPANKILAMEDLNHLFQNCDTGDVFEYATIDETISPQVLDIVCEWINNIPKRQAPGGKTTKRKK